MTFRELVESSNRQLDQEFDNQLYVDWINECLDSIAEDVYMPTKVILSTNSANEITLPANYKKDLQVRVVGDKLFSLQVSYDEPSLSGFTVYGDTVTIVNRGYVAQVEILYDRRPTYIINDPTASPDLPEQFHYVISAFCRKKAMLQIEDIAADERYSFYENEYLVGRQKIKEYFDKRRTTTSVTSGWKVVR